MGKRKILIGLFAFFVAILLLSLASCATMQQAEPKTVNAKLLAINAAITQTGKTTIDLYNAKKIDAATVKTIFTSLSTAANLADAAQQLYQENPNASNVQLLISEAIAALDSARNIITPAEPLVPATPFATNSTAGGSK
jgi:hypothetical protein